MEKVVITQNITDMQACSTYTDNIEKGIELNESALFPFLNYSVGAYKSNILMTSARFLRFGILSFAISM